MRGAPQTEQGHSGKEQHTHAKKEASTTSSSVSQSIRGTPTAISMCNDELARSLFQHPSTSCLQPCIEGKVSKRSDLERKAPECEPCKSSYASSRCDT